MFKWFDMRARYPPPAFRGSGFFSKWPHALHPEPNIMCIPEVETILVVRDREPGDSVFPASSTASQVTRTNYGIHPLKSEGCLSAVETGSVSAVVCLNACQRVISQHGFVE